ncbi:MAG: methionyl-tRNA formyltransferase, partial [Microgenomates group bacterium]
MKIVFFGTPDYVMPVLTSLHKKFVTGPGKSPIVAVVTQSPKPNGRKQILTYSPVDRWAHDHKIDTYYQASELVDNKVVADIGVLASYGQIIPQNVIDLFPQGILVIHPSLLPQFRWASPIPATLITNTNPTGVTILKMNEKFDKGPIVSQFKEDVLSTDTTESLRQRLFEKSAKVMVELLEPYITGKIKLKPQNDDEASYAKLVKKEDAFVPTEILSAALKGKVSTVEWLIPFMGNYSLTPNAQSVESFIRAMQPWPIAWTKVKIAEDNELRLK